MFTPRTEVDAVRGLFGRDGGSITGTGGGGGGEKSWGWGGMRGTGELFRFFVDEDRWVPGGGGCAGVWMEEKWGVGVSFKTRGLGRQRTRKGVQREQNDDRSSACRRNDSNNTGTNKANAQEPGQIPH